MKFGEYTVTREKNNIVIKAENGKLFFIGSIKGNAEETLHDFLYIRREAGDTVEDLQVIVDKVREALGETETQNTWIDTCNAIAVKNIVVIEKVMKDFEIAQKDNKDIEAIKAMHCKILANLKESDAFQVKRDFANCVSQITDDAVLNWKKFINCVNESAKAGRDYRK